MESVFCLISLCEGRNLVHVYLRKSDVVAVVDTALLAFKSLISCNQDGEY